ncbi:DUF3267 domain-containing protein [Corynebacterium sp. YIM 101645]|uniref:DUF3267 domain-containing protein n=1 Tax=Corynebacterium lemuris TaxID=1859292 RepID=A0ABT2FXG9_9CORY|nr:DUF3267 domain-containing protein [Corynebacterium lemuris]MCS5479937.1 DUF3267 domain-containing protein [Corynebacterium lemuris]
MSTQHHQDTLELPMTYHRHVTVDFKKDRKFFLTLQAVFLVVVLIAAAVALVLDLPLASGWNPGVTTLATVLSLVVYMAVHEATHGISLRLLTGTQPSYSVRFPFLSTSSSLYLTRRSLIIAALAPCLIWGTVLLAALFLVPADARLTVYILLALNFAGSAGDYLEAALALRQPREALLQDEGDRVHVFLPGSTEKR